MSFNHALSTNNYGPAKFVVATSAANGTHTSLTSAMAAASSGDTIFLRDSVTENVTITPGVNIAAWQGGILNTPSITGTLTMTGAGTSTLSGLRLVTNSAPLITVSGSAASILQVYNCYLNCSNNTGISYTTSSSSSLLLIERCRADIGTTGIALVTSTSPGQFSFNYSVCSNTGASTTASSTSSGNVAMSWSTMSSPLSTSSTGSIVLSYCNINTSTQNATCLTTAGTGNSVIEYSDFVSGSASAMSVGSGTTIEVTGPCRFDSSNTNAITGSGTLDYTLLTFTGSSSTNNVSTQNLFATQPSLSALFSPVYFQAYRSSAQTISAAATTTVVFDSTLVNQGGAYNTGTGVFTAPATGFYSFAAQIYFNLNITGAQTDALAAYIGSVQSSRLMQVSSVALDGTQGVIGVAWSMPMTAGDTLKVETFCSGTGTYQAFGEAISSTPLSSTSQWSGFRVA